MSTYVKKIPMSPMSYVAKTGGARFNKKNVATTAVLEHSTLLIYHIICYKYSQCALAAVALKPEASNSISVGG